MLQLIRLREDLSAEVKRDESSIADNLKACDELSRRLAMNEREHKDLVAGIKTRYSQLEQTVAGYHKRIEEAFAAAAK